MCRRFLVFFHWHISTSVHYHIGTFLIFAHILSRYLSNPIEYLKGVGPQKGDLLKKELSIFSYDDLLRYYPYRYIDRTKFYKVAEIESDLQYIQLKGTLTNLSMVGQGRAHRLVGGIKDETGTIELVWFQGAQWVAKALKVGQEYIVFGKPNAFNGRYSLAHPEMELVTQAAPEKLTGFQPMYNTTEKVKMKGFDNKSLGKLVKALLDGLQPADVPEMLPPSVMHRYQFMDRYEALKNIHFPIDNRSLDGALKRLKFEEFFTIQVKLLGLKNHRQTHKGGYILEKIDNYFDKYYKHYLPFELTEAQKRVTKEIRRDVLTGKQMNRLVQGDVGSGKTVVALMTMLMAIDNGFQAAMMAPTEILAQQHFNTLSQYVGDLGPRVDLLTGSVKGKERRLILEDLKEGKIDILIGTHALIEDAVQFQNLGFVVIDEQHRFGVAQRAALWEKNERPPHILVMTATPIPRTLAMTLYGDLDISVIDQLPPGRKPIKTLHYFESKRLALFGFMKQQIELGRQVYVVYPMIKENEKLDYQNLMEGYESITRAFPLPDYKVSVVHGQMKSADKDLEMQRFARGETQIMVATTVIEVGVNVPNASVMVIESAERFGLSQLHQLRGRVGRGAEQSYCILMTGNKLSADARIRTNTMVETNDGFIISEVDLKLRGPGDLEGTQQSGLLDLRLADIGKDQAILQEARTAATQLLMDDPKLQQPENQPFRQYLASHYKHSQDWSVIS